MSDPVAIEVASMAGRLGALLDRALPDHGGAINEARAFLRSVAHASASGTPGSHASGPDPLQRLTAALGLARVEVDLLVLAGLADEHEGFAGVFRSVHPRGEPYATTGLAAQLFCESPDERTLLRDVLARGTARRVGLIRLEEDRPFFERSLYVADELWSVLHGIDVWPAAVTAISGPAPSFGLERWLETNACRRAIAALTRGDTCTILVTADSEAAACDRAMALAAAAGVPAVRLALATPTGSADFERLVSAHALARGIVPIVRLPAPPDGVTLPQVPEFAAHPGPVVLCGRAGAVHPAGTRPVLPVPVTRLSHRDRRDLWAAAMPELRQHASLLGARYAVEPATAAIAAGDARAIAAAEGREPTLDDVATSIRVRTSGVLTAGVKLIRPTATWDRLVLPHDRMLQLREAVDRLLNQARVIDEWGFLNGRPGSHGVRMLFAGPPGTGKTLAAEVLAHELGVDLMLVDIARVVSKWIGETEKNLSAVFDAAEQAQAVLLFDEADALFGKRTEISDAHDRYANLETAYLLSRLERFDGLAILSTNLRQNIDPAFVRRLEFVVEFNEPNLAERLQLWRCHIPKDAPVEPDVDLHQLATLYPIVGGLIRNAAVAAGFMAAAENRPIGRAELVRAVRREYDKAGRAFPGAPWGLDAT